MLFRNLQAKEGYVVWARYVVENINDNVLLLWVETRNRRGDRLSLSRFPCDTDDADFSISVFRRRYLSIRVHFAFTTNKSHGQSFLGALRAGLSHENFIHGQLYVPLWLITHQRNLDTFTDRTSRDKNNVVFKYLLCNYVLQATAY